MNNNPSFPHDDNILARFFGRSSNYTDIPNQLFKEHNVKKVCETKTARAYVSD